MRETTLTRDSDRVVLVIRIHLSGRGFGVGVVDRAGYAVAIIDESLLEGEFEQDAVIDVFRCGLLPDLLSRKVVGTGVH